MAEPFSIATGAIQVAGAGFQLAKTIHDYMNTVKNAHKHIKAIAIEVRLTSSVLEHLGDLLNESEAEKLCSKNIATDARAAFGGCEDAFREVEEAFKVLVRPQADGTKSVSVAGRFSWPFRKGKFEALQANLERLKTTLLLMLSVLGYARDKAAKPTAAESQFARERLQIQNLMKAKEDATERYERLVIEFRQFRTADTTFAESRPSQHRSNGLSPFGSIECAQATVALMESTTNVNTTRSERSIHLATLDSNNRETETIRAQLNICSAAVLDLTRTIDSAFETLDLAEPIHDHDISASYSSLQPAMAKLLAIFGKTSNENSLLYPYATSRDQTYLPTSAYPDRSYSDFKTDMLSGQEQFPSLGFQPTTGEFLGNADRMSPPEISIDFAPPAPAHRMENVRPSNDGEALSPPLRSKPREHNMHISFTNSDATEGRNRVRAKSDSLSAWPASCRPASPARGRSSSLQPDVSDNDSDQRDYILNLAEPERAPSNSLIKDGRVPKHPATFQCTLCPKRFTRAYNLRSHLRTHTEERPFKCTVCGKAFARSHDRKRHEGLHSGEKEFVCKGSLQSGNEWGWGCGRRFSRADALGRHFRSEAGRVCIKPLLDEEAAERQEQFLEDQAQQQASHPIMPQPVDMLNNFLPAALLQQYPALAGLDWSSIPQGPPPEEDYSGLSNFDASSGGEYYQDLSESEKRPGQSPHISPVHTSNTSAFPSYDSNPQSLEQSTSVDPSIPQGQNEWSNMNAYRGHRRTASDFSDYSSHSNQASPYMPTLDTFDNTQHSPLLNPSRNPTFYGGLGLEQFSLNEDTVQQPQSYPSPGQSPHISPHLTPQQQQLPPFTAENNFGMNVAASKRKRTRTERDENSDWDESLDTDQGSDIRKAGRVEEPWSFDSVDDLVRRWTTVEV